MDRSQLLDEFRRQVGRLGAVNAYQYMKDNHKADMEASEANWSIEGEVPDVAVGMIFRSFYELMVVGVHGSRHRFIYHKLPLNGAKSIAFSVVIEANSPLNEAGNCDIIVCGGEGGNPNATTPGATLYSNDQIMTDGNAAMARSIEAGNAIRVIKEVDGEYRYEGLYQTFGWESTIMEGSGAIAYKFMLKRME